MIENQDSGTTYKFLLISWIQLLSMPTSLTKESKCKNWVIPFEGHSCGSLINRFSSQKRKFTNEEPQLGLALPQALKEPAHTVQLKEKRRRFMYSILGRNIQNALLSASPLFPSAFRRTEVVSSCIIHIKT